MLDDIFAIHELAVQEVPLSPHRYRYDTMQWDSRALCILRPRGVGRTTMLLQHYHEAYGDIDRSFTHLFGANPLF